jgi:hypothetical protein
MSFNSRETSRAEGEPINLYFFRYGDAPDAYWAYTDAEQPVEHDFDPEVGLVVFEPVPIDRGSIVSSGTLDRAAMEIKTPQDSELAMLFRIHPPSQVVVLTVFQGHVGDLDFKVCWAGRVLGCQLNGNEAEFTCEPVSTSMKRAGLRRNWQYGCPHVLYGPQCKADREDASIVTTVTGVAGALVSVDPAWAPAEMRVKYLGGLAEYSNADGVTEIRTVIRLADSDTLVLSGYALGLVPGSPIKLSFGCNHIWNEDCTNLHNNVQNFGGHPFIPTKNPIGIVNNFY